VEFGGRIWDLNKAHGIEKTEYISSSLIIFLKKERSGSQLKHPRLPAIGENLA
jgi:hypothetical protein